MMCGATDARTSVVLRAGPLAAHVAQHSERGGGLVELLGHALAVRLITQLELHVVSSGSMMDLAPRKTRRRCVAFQLALVAVTRAL